jgi:peroxiredoxin
MRSLNEKRATRLSDSCAETDPKSPSHNLQSGVLHRSLLLIAIGGIFTVIACIYAIEAAPPTASYEYQDIQRLYKQSRKTDKPEDRELLIQKSRAFIEKHPTYKRVDEVYYFFANALTRTDKTKESVAVYQQLIEKYPKADYLAPALLELGLAYDKLGQHDKADAAYKRLVKHPKYGSRSFGKIAKERLALDKSQRTDESSSSQPSAVLVGKKAIDFNVKDLDGKELSLEKYRGKVVLLDFWAVWCGPCLAEMPNLKKAHKQFKGKNFQIVGISLDKDKSTLLNYMKKQGITWPQFFDGNGWNNEIAKLYKVNSIPRAYLIDGEGVIRKANLRGRALHSAIAELIRENDAKLAASEKHSN